jgi:uncharacterized repeat protein (TIGR03806 family)
VSRAAIAGAALLAAASLAATLAGARSPPPSPPLQAWREGAAFPPRLSDCGVFEDISALRPTASLIPYDINLPFWSDGAAKRRWMSLPDASAPGCIGWSPEGAWSFPAGTLFVKHFELPASAAGEEPCRIETRLLVVTPSGETRGVSYRWRADQREADLVSERRVEPPSARAGAAPWFFPSPQDCGACHNLAAGGVLGANTRQLQRPAPGAPERGPSQLVLWNRAGWLAPPLDEEQLDELPRLRAGDDETAPLELRARSWLDVNCAACHRPGGAVADFDARFSTPLDEQGLLEARPRLDLGVDGARLIAPRDPWRSILLRRLQSPDQIRMPPLGHELPDREGEALIDSWILSLPGLEVLPPPAFTPSGGEHAGPLNVVLACSAAQAQIRYTLDGSVPRESSPLACGPIRLERSTTLRAKAWREGFKPSVVAQQSYVLRRVLGPAGAGP